MRIRDVEPLAGYWLRLTLSDGSIVERDIRDLLVGRVFDPIRSDDAIFRSVKVADGTISWPGGVDLDPDVLIWGGSPDPSPNSSPVPSLRLNRPVVVP